MPTVWLTLYLLKTLNLSRRLSHQTWTVQWRKARYRCCMKLAGWFSLNKISQVSNKSNGSKTSSVHNYFSCCLKISCINFQIFSNVVLFKKNAQLRIESLIVAQVCSKPKMLGSMSFEYHVDLHLQAQMRIRG